LLTLLSKELRPKAAYSDKMFVTKKIISAIHLRNPAEGQKPTEMAFSFYFYKTKRRKNILRQRNEICLFEQAKASRMSISGF